MSLGERVDVADRDEPVRARDVLPLGHEADRRGSPHAATARIPSSESATARARTI